MPLPIYDLQNTSGQPHQRNFDIIAKVGAIASNGTGTSKKDAKRDAATALLDKLKALGSEVAIAAGSGTNGTGNLSEVDEEMIKQAGNMTKVDVLVSFISFLLSLLNVYYLVISPYYDIGQHRSVYLINWPILKSVPSYRVSKAEIAPSFLKLISIGVCNYIY